MNRLIIAVTGTPGTGKTVLAKRLHKRLSGSSVVEINDIVNRYRLYSKKDKFGTKIVNLGNLNKKLNAELRKNKNRIIIVAGHLAPELSFRCNLAIVTRCGLVELARRLEKRKYKREKAAENIVAEAVNYCGAKIRKRCKSTFEVETAEEKSRIINYIASLSKDMHAKKPKSREINKIADLETLVRDGNRYGL